MSHHFLGEMFYFDLHIGWFKIALQLFTYVSFIAKKKARTKRKNFWWKASSFGATLPLNCILEAPHTRNVWNIRRISCKETNPIRLIYFYRLQHVVFITPTNTKKQQKATLYSTWLFFFSVCLKSKYYSATRILSTHSACHMGYNKHFILSSFYLFFLFSPSLSPSVRYSIRYLVLFLFFIPPLPPPLSFFFSRSRSLLSTSTLSHPPSKENRNKNEKIAFDMRRK